MNFLSPTYGTYLVLLFVVYWALPWRRAQHALLLAASYMFYAYWDVRFASLLAVSTLIDYVAGAAIGATDDPRRRRWWVVLSLVTNLGMLGVFKYFHFFVDSFLTATATLGLHLEGPAIHVVLPVGISFFTFQSMSYTLDIHGGRLRPTHDPIAFALYVSFFPQLVAGPIVRAREFLPQLTQRRVADPAQWQRGLEQILVGLVKKGVIADSLAYFCDDFFANPGTYSTVDAVVGLVAFYGQIYCDFSGYTDIAIGSAALFGFSLPKNFDRPYLARSPQEFWRRWHISLSTWLRDYLYIPLGGNRHGPRRQQWNLLHTMLLGGLWHGAAWHFLWWGGWHGGLLCANHAHRQNPARRTIPVWVAWLGTQAAVCLGWALFRAPDTTRLTQLGATLLRQDFAWPTPAALGSLGLCALVVGSELARPVWPRLAQWPWLDLALRPLVYVACMYAVLFLRPFDSQVFIYFQF